MTSEASRGYWSGREICGLRVKRNSTGRSCRMLCGRSRREQSLKISQFSLYFGLLHHDKATATLEFRWSTSETPWPTIGYSGHVDRRREAVVVLSRATAVPAAVLQESDSSLWGLWQFLKFPLPSYILLLVNYWYCSRYVLVL